MSVLAGSLLALSSGLALAFGPELDPPPCNSWCQRWMRLGQDDAPPVPPASVQTDSAATAAVLPGSDVGPRSGALIGAAPGRAIVPPPHLATAEGKPSPRAVPLPPRRVRAVVASAAMPVRRPVAPVLPTLQLPSPPPPSAPMVPADTVAQSVVVLPAPPEVPKVEVQKVEVSEGVAAPLVAAAQVEPAAVFTPALPEHPVEPVRLAAASTVTEPQARPVQKARPADASWPPPIDVIGAVLFSGGP